MNLVNNSIVVKPCMQEVACYEYIHVDVVYAQHSSCMCVTKFLISRKLTVMTTLKT